jgi:hypothetical protein
LKDGDALPVIAGSEKVVVVEIMVEQIQLFSLLKACKQWGDNQVDTTDI